MLSTTYKLTLAAAAAALFGSCSEDIMDRINNDGNHAHEVEAKFMMPDLIASTAFYNIGSDLTYYPSTYIEYEVGVEGQMHNAETRNGEPSASSTTDNTWKNQYNSLKNARIIISQCAPGKLDEDNDVTKGMAEVMAAYNGALLTDAYGNTPYSQAALTDENGLPVYLTPKIDTQESIYEDVLTLLDDAIDDLKKSDRSPVGSYDLLYGGDADKWIKFAYGLKARYTMHLLHRSANQQADLQNVLSYIEQSFQSADEQAVFSIYDGATQQNPLYAYFDARSGLACSQSLVNKLSERNDPRLSRVFLSPSDQNGVRHQVTDKNDPNLKAAPNGEAEQSTTKYAVSAFMYAGSAPTLLLSYHELLFIKAEALQRLNDPSAEDALKAAVAAGIANAENSVKSAIKVAGSSVDITANEMTQAVAEAYFDNDVQPLYAQDPLKEIMIQKYFALWGASGEAFESYNDMRRFNAMNNGTDMYALENPLNADGKFPLRLPYGNSDVSANPEVKKAYGNGQYVYTENVWWAGGSR